MRIQDCISSMSKLYLNRIVDSIIKEAIPKGDEERMREQIVQNKGELVSFDRIRKSLDLRTMTRSNRVLLESILTNLLELPDLSCNDEILYNQIRTYEKNVVSESGKSDVFLYSDSYSIDIYQSVLKVALDDNDINEREFIILETLRKKLKVSRLEHRLLEAQLGKYPKPENQLHNLNEFKDAIKVLQNKGILFFCNKKDNLVVLPEEIAPSVKKILGFELKSESFRLLLENLTSQQLHTALKSFNLPVAGAKSEKIDRIISAGIKPSEILNGLSSDELTNICKKLKGVFVSGTKENKVNRIIEYYGSLSNKVTQETEDVRETYFQYYEELAHRNNKELYSKKIITKDKQIENYFEEATRYIFEVKLNQNLIQMEGSENPDGAIEFGKDELLYWDNKSKENDYSFPNSHFIQFRRYIRNSAKRVNLFLIIVPEIDERNKLTEGQARKLKFETGRDTDIAIIRARDFKFVAENWKKYCTKKNEKFTLQIFNHTGILDRSVLEQNMKLIL